MLDYFFHQVKNPKIVMAILVKDEKDIIRENILFHNYYGVDAFVIMDNNSTDGTREILEELKKEVELTVIDEKEPYQQSKFMTKLARIAKKKYNPDWIINNDADEFWLPEEDSYKNILNFKGGVLFVRRTNMILYEGFENWKKAKYRVVNPICREEEFRNNYFLGKIGRKTIVNPHGYIKTNSGNHSAEHIAFWKKRECKRIKIFHYPIRNYEYFEHHVKNRAKLLKQGMKMGEQYRKYAKAYKNGALKKLYESMFLKKEDINILKKVGILKEDLRVYNTLEKLGLV